MRNIWQNVRTLYGIPRASALFVYMLQSVEYRAWPYLVWFWQTQQFGAVMHRRTLELTRAARFLRAGLFVGMLLQLAGGITLLYLGWHNLVTGGIWFGLALIMSYPLVWAHVVAVVSVVGQIAVIGPREARHIVLAERIFASHPGRRIAIAGSYGKTSMKELLVTVLGEGKKVAATPANQNVLSSHARFANSLVGDEDIVVVEFGEGKPGDVKRFTDVVHPTDAVITGIAAAHLDRYKTIVAAASDIFSVATDMPADHVYVNTEAEEAAAFMREGYQGYDRRGALGWRAQNISVDITGTRFELTKGTQTLRLASQLLGLHQVGPLAFAAALGLSMGLTEMQVVTGIGQTKPFEHRMQPYQLAGAWIIDDTYNGNLEGIRAGTELLASLEAKRKLYVTPGLVEQGDQTAAIHQTVGDLIAKSNPDVVVLMQNSATEHIQTGLTAAGYKGKVMVQTDPLDFYQHLDHFVAAGDVMLMQNDWTDNYR